MTHRTNATTRRALVAACIVLAACGGGDSSSDSSAAATTTTEPPTTTAAPTTTERATTTTRAPEPVYPLTGIGKPDKDIRRRPALVVKIDNAPPARPQTGFNSADIVVEEIVNDSLTRFAMVFHSGDSNPVGPIRSGRIQDIDLFGSFDRPLFAWSGGNATVTDAIRASDLVEIGPSTAYAAYFRSSDRSAPSNLYATTDALRGYTPPDAGPPPQQFRYRPEGAKPQGEPADGVVLQLDSVDVRWDWDQTSGSYLRTMEGVPHVDAGTGTQVSTTNVVVLVMNYLPGISGSPDAQSIGSGDAYVFSGGRWVVGRWNRPDRLAPFDLRDNSDRRILLGPGRTFVELPRAGFTFPLLPED